MLNSVALGLGTKRSCIRELFEYGNRRSAEIGRENVYDYSLGNPSVASPAGVNQALKALIEADTGVGLHGYTSASGDKPAREAIAADLNGRYGCNLTADNFFITCGAAPALTAALGALSVPEGEIIGIAPYFPEYAVFVAHTGMRFVTVPADKGSFQIRLDKLEEAITEHTQAVIVNSPNNPSGSVYSAETLAALGALLTKKGEKYGHPIYILADEPYRELVYDGLTVPFIPQIYANTVVCYSYSKSLSLPGERVGYVCVPDEAADAKALYAAVAGAARAMGHVCAPSLMQKMIVSCAGLRPDIEAYDLNRKLLYNALTAYGYRCAKPQGAFYLFAEAPGGDAQAFSDFAKQYDLLIVPGGDFGCPDWFRASTCVSTEMIQKSLPVFERVIKEYRG